MSHTPGPWYDWLPHGCDGGCRTIRTEEGRARGSYHGAEIAYTCGLADDDEDKANARLIAAAPDLLEALKAITKVEMPERDNSAWREVVQTIKNIARDAIKSAEGREGE